MRFERLINIKRLVFTADGLSITTYDLHHEQWVPVTERLFRRENQSVGDTRLVAGCRWRDADPILIGELSRKFPRCGSGDSALASA